MNPQNKKTYIKLLILVIFCLVFFTFTNFLVNNIANKNISETPPPATTSNIRPIIPSFNKNNSPKTETVKPAEEKGDDSKNTASFTLLAGEMNTNLSFAPNTPLYDALVNAKNASKITFSGKNYPGLGFFVTDIGSLHAGSGKYLLYYINGKDATVGVSAYILKDGDTIEWKLE